MKTDRAAALFPSEAAEARYALRLAAALTERSAALPADVSERLRHARQQALGQAVRATRLATPTASAGPTLALGGPGESWWTRLGGLLPLAALVGGLWAIQYWHAQSQISTAAEIDVSLLSDDLPPAAYSDPGFVEFLKSSRD